MRRATLPRPLALDDLSAVADLVARCRAASGHRPLNDHLMVELHHGLPASDDPLCAGVVVDGADGAVAYAQTSHVGGTWVVGAAVDPAADQQRALLHAVVEPVLDHIQQAGGGHTNWWVMAPDATTDIVAADLGLVPGRELLQLRRPLLGVEPPELVTRPFVVGRDEEAWLAVNNRAFAWHDEQGGWDMRTLQAREDEDWFDPAGFLVHERDGVMAGFCWTKIHRDEEPLVGEIYVIAVDPAFTGLGLGRDLTSAGLASLAARGVHHGMLFVDATNEAAVALYASLGFATHRIDRAYTANITTDTDTRSTTP